MRCRDRPPRPHGLGDHRHDGLSRPGANYARIDRDGPYNSHRLLGWPVHRLPIPERDPQFGKHDPAQGQPDRGAGEVADHHCTNSHLDRQAVRGTELVLRIHAEHQAVGQAGLLRVLVQLEVDSSPKGWAPLAMCLGGWSPACCPTKRAAMHPVESAGGAARSSHGAVDLTPSHVPLTIAPVTTPAFRPRRTGRNRPVRHPSGVCSLGWLRRFQAALLKAGGSIRALSTAEPEDE